MLLVLLPFGLLVTLVEWQQQIQIGASLLVGFGIFRFVDRRHPRALARIRPTQLGLWSFAVAIAHGAGLMLVPIYLGLCRAADLDRGHEAAGALLNANLGMAVLVSVVHSVAMMMAGGFSAWLVYSLARDHPCEPALSRSISRINARNALAPQLPTTTPPQTSGKPRGTFIDATFVPNKRGQGLRTRLVLHRVPQHPRPIGSRSFVDLVTIRGAHDQCGEGFVSRQD
jgi:hypothetical protein